MKIMKRVMSGILCIALILVGVFQPTFALKVEANEPEEKKAEIATWEGWRTCAVTFTFNQGAPSHYSYVAPEFEKRGYRASFYLVSGWNPNWTEFQKLADKGHEIGTNGSRDYANVGNNMAGDEKYSKRAIEDKITSKYGCITVAYPNGNLPNVDEVKANYIAGLGTMNFNLGVQEPSIISKDGTKIINWTNVPTYFTGTESGIQSADDFKRIIGDTENKGGWVVFSTFGLSGKQNGNATYSPINLKAITDTLDLIKNGDYNSWVAPTCNVAMYIKERNASTFTLKESSKHCDTYTLTHEIADKVCVYDYPLSVRVSAPELNCTIKVTQNGKEIESEIKDGMVYFSAVPNGGDIVVSACKDCLKKVEKKNPTCEEDGVVAYYQCYKCDKCYADPSGIEEIKDLDAWKKGDGKADKLGHKYGVPTFTWNGYKSVKATFSCVNDNNHKLVKNATITKIDTKNPTIKAAGYRYYTASVTFDGKTYTDTKNEILPKLKVGDKLTDIKTKATYKLKKIGKKSCEVEYLTSINTNVTSITIPATITVDDVNYKVTSISAKSFKNNKKIKKIVIGKNITLIGKSAFEGCKKLKNVTIKTTKLNAKTVGAKAFKGINAKAKVKVPKAKFKAYKKFLKKRGINGKKQKITK